MYQACKFIFFTHIMEIFQGKNTEIGVNPL